MSDKAFFDTNVLVYAFDNNEPEKSIISKRLIHDFGADGRLVLSTQVLQELYVTLSKVGKSLLTQEEAEEIVNNFAEFPLVQVDKNIVSQAMKRHRSKVFSFWDALIVEAALQSGCSQLWSEDMHNDQVLGPLTIRNPFACDPFA